MTDSLREITRETVETVFRLLDDGMSAVAILHATGMRERTLWRVRTAKRLFERGESDEDICRTIDGWSIDRVRRMRTWYEGMYRKPDRYPQRRRPFTGRLVPA